jgi:biotin carboxylase
MRRVMLLMSAATYRARAFLDSARWLGVPVVVGTDRASVFDDSVFEGLLTLDFERPSLAARTAADYHTRYPISAILACDDDGARAAAAIAERLGLAGSPQAAVARALDKRLMRDAWAEAGVPSPWYEALPAHASPDRMAPRMRYPCVLKPPSLSASRGVLRADSPAAFVTAFQRVRHVLEDAGVSGDDAEILVEEYVPGTEVAVEGLLTRGRLGVLAVFDKPDPLEGPTFEETIYVTPSRLAPAALAAADAVVASMASALGLTHGAVHAEVRLNERGWWPIEIAPRSIGGLCSRALRFSGGATLEDLLLRHALGEDVRAWTREAAARGVMMIPIPRGGILHGVSGIEQALAIPGVEDLRVTIPLGHPVVPLPEGNRYLGFVFATGNGPAEVEVALRGAHDQLRFEIHTE